MRRGGRPIDIAQRKLSEAAIRSMARGHFRLPRSSACSMTRQRRPASIVAARRPPPALRILPASCRRYSSISSDSFHLVKTPDPPPRYLPPSRPATCVALRACRLHAQTAARPFHRRDHAETPYGPSTDGDGRALTSVRVSCSSNPSRAAVSSAIVGRLRYGLPLVLSQDREASTAKCRIVFPLDFTIDVTQHTLILAEASALATANRLCSSTVYLWY